MILKSIPVSDTIQKGTTERSPSSNHKERTNLKPKNTICLWFDKDPPEGARFYSATLPDSPRTLRTRASDSKATAVHKAPGDYPSGKKGDVLTVEFTVLGVP